MSYQALARKWRPRQFSEVLGQQHVVAALTNALDNERVHHAYLFTGTRGVGKTTLARIFARALNCETGITSLPCGECAACVGVDRGNYIDLLEVDAASRTRVDDTRELLDNVQYAPTQGRFKIYLIDEVHMLSTHSFNALLKTLEEPPAHVKFLLATTDPQKLPATILSRCIQFNLKAMDVAQLDSQLSMILGQENIESDDEARRILARSADGSVRDALSLLDQAVAFGNGEVRTEQVRSMLGMIDDHFVYTLLDRILAQDGAGLLETIASMAERTVDYAAAMNDVLGALHYAALYQVDPGAVAARGVVIEPVATIAEQTDPELLQLLYQLALLGKRDFSLGPDPRSSFEMAMLRMSTFQPDTDGGRVSSPPPVRATARPARRPDNAAIESAAASRAASGATTTGLAAIRRDREAISDRVASPKQPVDSGPAQEPKSGPKPELKPEAASLPPGKGHGDTPAEARARLADKAGWASFVENCALTGMPRELVMNMTPERLDGEVLHVLLDDKTRHLMKPDRLQKIEQYLAASVDQPLSIEVRIATIAEDAVATPAQRRQKAAEDRQQNAENVFTQDPNVQSLVDLFDAEIVPDSVRPAS